MTLPVPSGLVILSGSTSFSNQVLRRNSGAQTRKRGIRSLWFFPLTPRVVIVLRTGETGTRRKLKKQGRPGTDNIKKVGNGSLWSQTPLYPSMVVSRGGGSSDWTLWREEERTHRGSPWVPSDSSLNICLDRFYRDVSEVFNLTVTLPSGVFVRLWVYGLKLSPMEDDFILYIYSVLRRIVLFILKFLRSLLVDSMILGSFSVELTLFYWLTTVMTLFSLQP